MQVEVKELFFSVTLLKFGGDNVLVAKYSHKIATM